MSDVYVTIVEEVIQIVEVGQQGPAGAQGPQGEQGIQGVPGQDAVLPNTATQAQAEDSGGTTLLSWTAQRIWQAITKWGDTAASVFSGLLKGYAETEHTLISAAGAVTVNLANGNIQRLDLTESITTWTFPTIEAGKCKSFTLKIIGNGTATVAWGGVTIDWQSETDSDTAPPLATTDEYVNTLVFVSDYHVSTPRWLGYFGGKETA